MRKLSLLIFVSYFLYFFLIPPFTVNDEPDHLEILVGVAKGTYPFISPDGAEDRNLGATEELQNALNYEDHPYQLPDFSTVSQLQEEEGSYDMAGVYSHEAYLPPVYYMVGAVFYYLSKITPYLLSQFYIMRLTSALFYFGMVFVAWKIASRLVKERQTAQAILLFFSLNPLVLKMGVGINPDIALTFFSLSFLYLFLFLPEKKFGKKHSIVLPIVSAIATLTKVSGLFTNAAFSLYLLYKYRLTKPFFSKFLSFQAVFIALTFPWFVFLFLRYGTFFPEPFTAICGRVGDGPLFEKLLDSITFFRYTFMHYAGFMGYSWPHPFDWFFMLYVVLFASVALTGAWYVFKEKQMIYKKLFFYTVPLLLLLFAISLQHRLLLYDCDIQGRYIMPVFFVLCYFLYRGLLAMTKNFRITSRLLIGFAVFHYLFILLTVLLLRYYV